MGYKTKEYKSVVLLLVLPVPLPLPLPGFRWRVLSQSGVVRVTTRTHVSGGVVVLRAALAGAGRAVIQRVRAVGVTSWSEKEVWAAKRAQVVRVCVLFRC